MNSADQTVSSSISSKPPTSVLTFMDSAVVHVYTIHDGVAFDLFCIFLTAEYMLDGFDQRYECIRQDKWIDVHFIVASRIRIDKTGKSL